MGVFVYFGILKDVLLGIIIYLFISRPIQPDGGKDLYYLLLQWNRTYGIIWHIIYGILYDSYTTYDSLYIS